MTYKGTSNVQNYLDRTGSHATKEQPSGRIDAIPAWAKEPEEYFETLKSQFDAMNDRLYKTTEQLQWLKTRLKNTLPYEEFQRLSAQADLLGPQHQELQQEVGRMRHMVRAAAENSWGIVFYRVAETILDREIFKKIDREAGVLLDRRSIVGVSKGTSCQSEERKAKRNIAAHKRDREKTWKQNLRPKNQSALVYSTERK